MKSKNKEEFIRSRKTNTMRTEKKVSTSKEKGLLPHLWFFGWAIIEGCFPFLHCHVPSFPSKQFINKKGRIQERRTPYPCNAKK